ncbi:MAG: hypothetical protein COA49_08965 [Bacteroidetes bacterium]|nr:MAG: hypothetical protein COA49_08965 [Bacteroidota bacterium]
MEASKNETKGEIRNRVDESGLLQLDLDRISEIRCVELDFTKWLWKGLVVKERDFRKNLEELDVDIYKGLGVGLCCTDEAIVPDWAWMLIASKLSVAEFVVVGGIKSAELEALKRAIENLPIDDYLDRKVVVRGCANSGGAETLVQIQQKLQPVVSSLMFGESCSTVPVYKKAKRKE